LVASSFGAALLLRHDDDCSCRHCVLGAEPALAYERQQTTYDEQAFQTNNRLERDGVKLDTAEQQSATLSDK
jgi:hypothetical protein